jgi:hypothetical protein
MTDVVPAGASNLPATQNEESLVPVGLEDFDIGTISLPPVRINGPAGTWVDTLTGDEWPEIEVILLGLVKQRVLWPPEMGSEPRPPLCRSLEAKTGTPTLETGPDGFPWKAAKLNRNTFVVRTEDPESGEQVENLAIPVPCSECHLKVWGTNPKGTGAPWCTEQMVFPLMLKRETDEGGELWTPGSLALARSGVKPANQYCMGYTVRQSPMFVDRTKLTLKQLTRGTVNYSVPVFTKLGPTERDMRDFYKDKYFELRAWLQTPRGMASVEDAEAPVPTVPAQRGAAAAPADEEPF